MIDVRRSPRFDMGIFNRKAAFALFREVCAVYIDLFAAVNRELDIESALLSEALRRRFASIEQGAAGPVMFLTDRQIAWTTLTRAVEKSLPAQQGEEWEICPLPAVLCGRGER